MSSNSNNFLKRAGELINGEIAAAEGQIAESTETKNRAVWEATINLICHAAINVFNGTYKKTIAKKFKTDVAEALGIQEKQAAKYTETISAALGVRMDKGGLKGGGLKGLRPAALTGVEEVVEFLQGMGVDSLSSLRRACQKDKDPIQEMAKKLQKLEPDAREEVMKLVKELDKAADKVAKATERAAPTVNGAAAHATA